MKKSIVKRIFFSFFYRKKRNIYVNGGKGVISILLALLLVAFTVLTDGLIEASRYHAVVSAVDEIMDSSATSTLAHYDSYLMDRFGLQAIDQNKDISDVYNNYYTANIENSNIAWKTDDLKVSGLYALDDIDVLKHQIVETSKYGVPTKLASDVAISCIDKLLAGFDSLDPITAFTKAIGKSADAVGALADVVKVLEDLKHETAKARNLENVYTQKFNGFKSKTESLASALYTVEVKEQDFANARNRERQISSQYQDYVDQLTQLEEEKEILTTNYSQNQMTEEEYSQQLDELDERIDSINEIIGDSNTELSNAHRETSNAQNALEEARNNVSVKQNEVDIIKNEYASSISELRTSLSQCKTYSEDVISKFATAANSCTDAVSEIGNAQITMKDQNQERAANLEKENEILREQQNNASSIEAGQELQNQINQNEQMIDYYNNDKTYSDEKANTGNYKTVVESGVTAVKDEIENGIKGYHASTVDNCLSALDSLFEKVSGFDRNIINSGFVCEASQYYVSIAGFASVEDIDKSINDIDDDFSGDAEAEEQSGNIGFWSLIKGFSSFMDGILHINLFYDASLDAVIKTDLIANEHGGIDAIITGIANIAGDCSELTSPDFKNKSTWKKVKAVSKLLADEADTLSNIIIFVSNTVVGIANVCNQFKNGAYDKLLIAEYLNLTCANRTTYNKSNVLTGYSFSSAGMGNTVNQEDSVFLLGDITALTNTINNYGTGKDNIFCGAETEYLLHGSRSELLNQTMTFLSLYILRLVLDFGVIQSDLEVQSIAMAAGAASFGIGSVGVNAIFTLVEPFLDAMVIANGGEIDFLKKCCYMTPSGIPTLFTRITEFKLTAGQADNMMEKYATVVHGSYTYGLSVKKDNTSFIKFDYSDYLLVFLLLHDNNVILKRFKNIIKLESKNVNSSFEMEKTYTYLSAENQGKYNPFLSVADIYANFLMSGKRKLTRGY